MKQASVVAALLVLVICAVDDFAAAQQPNLGSDQSASLSKFPFQDTVPLKIVRDAIPAMPFTVIGPRGAILGQQDGSFEAWIFPWKIFSNFRITAEMQNYPVPIDVNNQAAAIEVRPDHTTITFSHANFTVREVFVCAAQCTGWNGCFSVL
jgi:hypothetical protein